MTWQDEYEKWRSYSGLDQSLRQEMAQMSDNEKALEDAFYKPLSFGTGGMRGLIGPGTNRMNIYTIRKASKGLAHYIDTHGMEAKSRGVVIAYDSRHFSKEFALETAKTLGQHGIQTYVFEDLRTTPELSFAVRYLHAFSGVVITASHNPPAYNGFKVYGEDGAQFSSAEADKLVSHVSSVTDELAIDVADEAMLLQSGLLKVIGDEVDRVYLRQLQTITLQPEMVKQVADDVTIVYTPLHGTGKRPVQEGLRQLGFKNVVLVPEQAEPDANFTTVKYPNPEEREAFTLAMKYGEEHGADILLATDPDTDRVGVAVRHDGDYVLLTGNQIGALLLHYLITQKERLGTLQENATVLKTIVTSELGRKIAEKHGLETIDTLTGFKYISAKVKEFEQEQNRSFLFGYEESYGYLIGDFVRDKDAVQACLLIAEVAAFYKMKHMTLYDGLLSIFETHGYFREGLRSITLEGKTGIAEMQAMMDGLRNEPPQAFAGKQVVAIEDYLTSERLLVTENRIEAIQLPVENVLKYHLSADTWVCVRPSGTEPKIKFYFGVKADTLESSSQLLARLETDVMERVEMGLNLNDDI